MLDPPDAEVPERPRHRAREVEQEPRSIAPGDGATLRRGRDGGRHILPDLVVVGAHGRPDDGLHAGRVGERAQCGSNHARGDAPPPCVHHGDRSRRGIDQGHGDAIRSQDRDRNARRGGHQGVGARDPVCGVDESHAGGLGPHADHIGRMHLSRARERSDTEGPDEAATVLSHHVGIVAALQTQVQPAKWAIAHPSRALAERDEEAFRLQSRSHEHGHVMVEDAAVEHGTTLIRERAAGPVEMNVGAGRLPRGGGRTPRCSPPPHGWGPRVL